MLNAFWSSRTLMQRVVLSFAFLITMVAALYGFAVQKAIEFTEHHLMTSIMDEAIEEAAELVPEGLPTAALRSKKLYDLEAEEVPDWLVNLPEGFTEIADTPALFVYKDTVDGRTLALVQDQEWFEEIERRLEAYTVVSVLVVFLLSGLLGWRLSTMIMAPVKKLSDAVRKADADVNAKPAPIDAAVTNDEVGELARLWNRAYRNLHDALEREKAFTGDVSHELRTPLSVIETSCELLDLSEMTPEQRRHLDKIQRSAADMREMLSVFLTFARLTAKTDLEEETVSETLVKTAVDWHASIEAEGGTLTLRTASPCPGLYPAAHVEAILNNLLRNARDHAPGTNVLIVEAVDGVFVADDGPGIPEMLKNNLWKPGRRQGVESERVGLGLSFAQRIAERNGWRLELSNADALKSVLKNDADKNLPKGAVFFLKLTGTDRIRKDVWGS